MARYSREQVYNMAAVTGQAFINILNNMLSRANMSGAAVSYYSFYPIPGQSEFVYNSLLPTGNMFLQKMEGMTISAVGSGYGPAETPTVTFTSIDAGTGMAATGLMSTVSNMTGLLRMGLKRTYQFLPTGNNLLLRGNFPSGVTGWTGFGGEILSGCCSTYCFSTTGLYASGVVAKMYPVTNTGAGTPLTIGNCNFWGSFDIIADGLKTVIFYMSGSGVGIIQPQPFVYKKPLSGTFYWGGL